LADSTLAGKGYKIHLKQPEQRKLDRITKPRVNQIRCFNCNSLVHIAAECRKPKRAISTCFAFGTADHRIAECQKRKGQIEQNTDNEYLKYIKFFLFPNNNVNFYLECLIGSGSPISFVKISVLKKKWTVTVFHLVMTNFMQ